MSQMRTATGEREVIYILDPPKPPTNGLGTAGFVFGILGIFTFGFLSPLGLLLSFFGLFKRPRGLAMTGFVLSLLGVGFIGSMIAIPAYHAQARHARRHLEREIRATMERIEGAMEEVEEASDEAKRELDGYEGNSVTVRHQDAWGNELRYDERTDGYAVRSAGPDRRFDTRDDLIEAKVDRRLTSAPVDGED